MDSRVKLFRDIHKGKRAFLVACGPSLEQTDVTYLKDEITYTVSLAYLKEGLKSTYHCIGDEVIASQKRDTVSKIPCKALFTSYGIYRIGYLDHPHQYFFRGTMEKKFETDFTKPLYGGWTSTYIAMQLAYYMGIQELYVLGLDHSWDLSRSIIVGTHTASDGTQFNIRKNPHGDRSHFSAEYYDKNTLWVEPNIQGMEEAYLMARQAYEADHRKIINVSLETSLGIDILPRMEYNAIIGE